MFAVMGATGRVGRSIAEQLLERGDRVRALARSRERLAELAAAGAEVRAGDAADAGYLTDAFAGADAVYTLLPYDVGTTDYFGDQRRAGEAIVRAARESGVRHLVFLSSLGADRPSGTGPIASLAEQEERLRRLDGVHRLVLRPGYFFENFAEALGAIRRHGVYADAYQPDLAFPMVATGDVARAAAEALVRRDWQGLVVRELLGPRDLSLAEATRILGGHLGRPDLGYVRLPYADVARALVELGFSEQVAGLTVDLARAVNEGRVRSAAGRTAESTTATEFEEFAGELVRAHALT